ncbi:Phosphoglycerate mutase [Paenibacillus curdlanolyticus YK9]|uniref:Phosphoglycerate mutase n=1 Tax=Paenibacillus curdlanolyticus YK9 TaxID=717606 RepID=E0IBJ4_9BACL|nr:histidine phosphatase family protein [Paenibacillus curdlanolyticus]EFM10074.1 Phosphoglycerate mutase [Paenibacillus curdlanolyticus YK9]
MTTIGLIRHGITDWNVLGKAQGITDIPLNEEGRKQASAIADRLSSETWEIIYSSDLGRAQQTAEAIGSSLGIKSLLIDERLREINCGQIEGTTEEERIARWGANWRELELGMERFDLVAKRGVEVIEEITIKHQNKNVLIVSHGALIGLSLQRLLPQMFPKTYIDNTSLTVIAKPQDVWECRLYNCTKHL